MRSAEDDAELLGPGPLLDRPARPAEAQLRGAMPDNVSMESDIRQAQTCALKHPLGSGFETVTLGSSYDKMDLHLRHLSSLLFFELGQLGASSAPRRIQ